MPASAMPITWASVHPHTRGDNGNTTHWLPSSYSVHPHTRGDNVENGRLLCQAVGSPPHAWGQWQALCASVLISRFTPTRVGTMAKESSKVNRISVHPHPRGDNTFSWAIALASFGSPPHAWGQFHPHLLRHTFATVHPHTRGDNSSVVSGSHPISVHPHTRGDNDME